VKKFKLIREIISQKCTVLSSLKAERGRIKYEQPIENIVRCGLGGGGGGEGEVEGGQATI
jgi:hypothetical protein